jgi:hypothetical protein
VLFVSNETIVTVMHSMRGSCLWEWLLEMHEKHLAAE